MLSGANNTVTGESNVTVGSAPAVCASAATNVPNADADTTPVLVTDCCTPSSLPGAPKETPFTDGTAVAVSTTRLFSVPEASTSPSVPLKSGRFVSMRAAVSRPAAHSSARFAALSPPAAAPPNTGAANNEATVAPNPCLVGAFADFVADADAEPDDSASDANAVGATAWPAATGASAAAT